MESGGRDCNLRPRAAPVIAGERGLSVTPDVFRQENPENPRCRTTPRLPAPVGLSNDSGPRPLSSATAAELMGHAMRGGAKAILVAVGALTALPVFAADLPTEKPAPAPIPCRPSLDLAFRSDARWLGAEPERQHRRTQPPGLPVYAGIFQLLPHLEGYVPVSFVAYNDTFIVGADLFWVRLGPQRG